MLVLIRYFTLYMILPLSAVGLANVDMERVSRHSNSMLIFVEKNPNKIDTESASCFIPSEFLDEYQTLRENLEGKLDEKITHAGLGFYDREFDHLEASEIQKMFGVAIGEITTLVMVSAPPTPLTKGVSLLGSIIFGGSLYQSIVGEDKFKSLQHDYIDKHRTLGDIKDLEEELAYYEALVWMATVNPKAVCE